MTSVDQNQHAFDVGEYADKVSQPAFTPEPHTFGLLPLPYTLTQSDDGGY